MSVRHWDFDGLVAELVFDCEIPELRLVWPAIASADAPPWNDAACFGLEALAYPRSSTRLVVEELLGDTATATILQELRSLGPQPRQLPLREGRAWSRSVERGFCPGDLVEEHAVLVTSDAVRTSSGEYSYGEGSSTGRACTLAEFTDPACPLRAPFAECLPRIDAYVGLLDALHARGRLSPTP